MLVSKAVEGVAAAEPVSEPMGCTIIAIVQHTVHDRSACVGLCAVSRSARRPSMQRLFGEYAPKALSVVGFRCCQTRFEPEHVVVVSPDPRIMKSRKVMQHHDLVHEVTTQVL